jgi:hypothetical protein
MHKLEIKQFKIGLKMFNNLKKDLIFKIMIIVLVLNKELIKFLQEIFSFNKNILNKTFKKDN